MLLGASAPIDGIVMLGDGDVAPANAMRLLVEGAPQ